MKVKTLRMQNFRGFEDVTLDFHDRITVLIGENGAGKSSVLDCLGIQLFKLLHQIYIYDDIEKPRKIAFKENFRDYTDSDIKDDQDYTLNKMTFKYENDEFELPGNRVRDGRESGKRFAGYLRPYIDNLKPFGVSFRRQFYNKQDAKLAIIVQYDVNRITDISLKIPDESEFDPQAVYSHAFRGGSDFKKFFEWFRGREDIENERKSQLINKLTYDKGLDESDIETVRQSSDIQLSTVKNSICEFISYVRNIHVQRKPPRLVAEKNGKELAIDQFSDGERCMIAMIGDIARRLATANPGLEDPLQGTGIVMIDEIELHLHPSWQRMIIPKLTEIFPNLQFIVTTHSPQVLGEVADGKVYYLEYDPDKNSIEAFPDHQFYGWDSNRLLEEKFGTPERNENQKKKLHELYVLLKRDDLTGAKKLRGELGKDFGDDPEFVTADMLIARKELENK